MTTETEKLSTKREVQWFFVILNLHVLMSCICGLHFVIYEAFYTTTAFSILLILLALIGITAGAHRLWAHRSYKANTSLRIFLMLCQTLAGTNSIYSWVHLHRLHHKHFQTDLDPYNPKKGFIYSHIISNNLKLSPAQEAALKEIDMSDLENDKVVMFQKRYYWILFAIVTLLLPLNAPLEYWNDSILSSVFVVGWLRFGITYHLSLLIHSAIKIFDFNEQDRNTFDSNTVFLVNKSYWLSYHYLSPWDYQTSEYGKYSTDCTSKFIRVCAALELAHDLKTMTSNSVRDALGEAVTEGKSVKDCLGTLEDKFDLLPKEHYLVPSKMF